MKNIRKNLIVVLALLVAVVFVLGTNVAWAQGDLDLSSVLYFVTEKSTGNEMWISQSAYNANSDDYELGFVARESTTENGITVGFSRPYFADIVTTVEIYSTEDFVIDFALTDGDWTELQQQTKQTLLDALVYAHKTLLHVDSIANTQINTSDVARYNVLESGKTLKIDYDTYKMFELAREIYTATNGAFNPAVYRLVDLWGFSSRIYSNGAFGLPYDRAVSPSDFFANGYPLPDQKYVDAFSKSAFTDFSQEAVTLYKEGDEYFVTKNVADAVVDGVSFGQWIDFGGIAKGYCADLIENNFCANGITAYYVNVGTSSIAVGSSALTLALSDPYDVMAQIYASTCYAGVNVQQNSISTSGQYVRKYVSDGVEYAHIVDGKKGAPAQTGIKTVSVIAPDGDYWSAKGDCLTTALTVMGRTGIVDFFNNYAKQNNLKIVVIYETLDGGRQILSNVNKQELVTTNTTFNNFGWAVENQNGTFVYNSSAVVYPQSSAELMWLVVTLAVILGFFVVGVVVLAFVKNAPRMPKILATRSSKLFKKTDIIVYFLVLLLIVSLFGAFFESTSQDISRINVCDMVTGDCLFVYNVSRNEYDIYQANGWQVQVTNSADTLTVNFTKSFDGEVRFNTLVIKTNGKTTVQMHDSKCGHSQDCVRLFGKITKNGGTIVCSPNRLKVVTE